MQDVDAAHESCILLLLAEFQSIASHERSERHQENVKVMMNGGRRRGPAFAASNLAEYNRAQYQMVEAVQSSP